MSYLGLDIGGTTLGAAVATDGVDPAATATAPTPRTGVTDRLCRLVEQTCGAAGLAPTDIAAACIGSVGPLDQKRGAVAGPANVADETVDLVEPLCALLETDAVALYNDATCGAIAEAHADPTAENLVYLTLSTGVGAGIVADGSPLSGDGGNAGEVGHLPVDPAGAMSCGCGGEGHWEAYCGGANLPRYARHLRETEAVETQLDLTAPDFTAADIFAAAGDPLADLVIERVGYWNTLGIATLVQTVAPECVAIGGAIARNNPEPILEPIRERLPEQTFLDAPEVRLATCEQPVLTGALVAAHEHDA